MTAFSSLDSAIGAIRAGAYDFVTKPVAMDALALVVERAAQHRRLQGELTRLRTRIDLQTAPRLAGDSNAMKQVMDFVARIGASDANVLITGESGTGKELIAKALHERSGRKGHFWPSIAQPSPIPCSKASCSGTRAAPLPTRERRAKDCSSEANGGTLFLDEIGRNAARHAGQDPACAPGADGEAGGRGNGASVRCPHHHRHQSQPRRGRRREAISRGPLLPDQRGAHRSSAASGTWQRRPTAGAPFPGP